VAERFDPAAKLRKSTCQLLTVLVHISQVAKQLQKYLLIREIGATVDDDGLFNFSTVLDS
jgi:hypothetical protein